MEAESSPISNDASQVDHLDHDPKSVSLPIQEQSEPMESADSIDEHLDADHSTDATLESSNVKLTGYELVADMMRRQDEVIEQIDDLNLRIEAAITEITDARKAEQAEEEAAAGQAETPLANDQESSISKAA